MFFSRLKNLFSEMVNYKIDVFVDVDKFELKDSYNNTYFIETFLHVDDKNIVLSVGNKTPHAPHSKKLQIFAQDANFEVACSILKYAVMHFFNHNKIFIRPLVNFHNVHQLPESYFIDPKNSDRASVRTQFFSKLGLAAGARKSSICS